MNTRLWIAVLSTCSLWLWQSGALAKLPPPQTAYSPDGYLLAVTVTGSPSPGIRLYDAHALLERGFLEEGSNVVYAVAFSPDGQTLASVGNYGVHLWDVEQRATRAILNIDEGSAITFRPKSRAFAVSGWDGTVRLWDGAQQQELAVLKGHSSHVYSVAFSADGQTLASGGRDKTVRLWDVAQQRERGVLRGHTERVLQVVFGPDGRTLASASEDRTVRLWDGAAQQERAVLHHPDRVFSVGFSPDGKLLATGGEEGTVYVWDVVHQKERGRLKGHTHFVSSVAFNPDGKTLVSASWDAELNTTVVLWEVETMSTAVSPTSWGQVKARFP